MVTMTMTMTMAMTVIMIVSMGVVMFLTLCMRIIVLRLLLTMDIMTCGGSSRGMDTLCAVEEVEAVGEPRHCLVIHAVPVDLLSDADAILVQQIKRLLQSLEI